MAGFVRSAVFRFPAIGLAGQPGPHFALGYRERRRRRLDLEFCNENDGRDHGRSWQGLPWKIPGTSRSSPHPNHSTQ